jgi:hypothetical protein
MILGIETHNIQHPILRAAAMNENPIISFGHTPESLISSVLEALEEICVFNPSLFRFAETQLPDRREALAANLFQRLSADEQRRLAWEALGNNPAYLTKTTGGVARWMN